MMTRLMAVSVVVLAFCACGPGAKLSGGKQGAAEALYAASGVTKGGQGAGSGIDANTSVDVKCPQGGSASLSGFALVTGAGGLTDISESFNANYNNCGVKTDAGNSVIQGSIKVTQSVKVTGSSVDINQAIKGKLTMAGAVDDFIDIDITQVVGVSALSQTTGAVSMTLKGSITDTEGKFTYDEAVSVTPGKITVEVATTKK